MNVTGISLEPHTYIKNAPESSPEKRKLKDMKYIKTVFRNTQHAEAR
jgi:hypothetical protein